MKILTRKLRRLRSLQGRERRMFAAALILLPLFWVWLRLFGPRAVAAALAAAEQPGREAGSASRAGGETAALALDGLTRIGALVNSAAHQVLPAGNCLTRSLYLQWLLKRRGVPTQLRIGVQLADGHLLAHAWVEYAGLPLNDAPDVAKRYAPFERPLPAEAWALA